MSLIFLPLLFSLKRSKESLFDKLHLFRRLLDATVKFAVCSQMNRQVLSYCGVKGIDMPNKKKKRWMSFLNPLDLIVLPFRVGFYSVVIIHNMMARILQVACGPKICSKLRWKMTRWNCWSWRWKCGILAFFWKRRMLLKNTEDGTPH